MYRIDIKKEFEDMFPWHYDALSTQKQDCPKLGTLDFDFKPLVELVFELCENQNPKTSGKGFSHYFENNKIAIIPNRLKTTPKAFPAISTIGANWDGSVNEFQNI